MRENVKMLVFVTNVLTFSRCFYKITTLYMKNNIFLKITFSKTQKVVEPCCYSKFIFLHEVFKI